MASSAVADELHMKTTEPQTTADSVEEPAPKSTEPPQDAKDSVEASPARVVKDDTSAPATMSGVEQPEEQPSGERDESQVLGNDKPRDEPQDVVSTLHSLFPNLDKETIEDVYRAEGQNADRTAQLLLQLSGQGDASEINAALHSNSDQISADEAFARQLQQEETAQQQSRGQQTGPQYGHLSYQPRVTPRAGPPPSQQGAQGYHESEREGGGEFDQALDQMKAGVATATEYGKGIFNKLSTRLQQLQVNQQEGGGAQQAQGQGIMAGARHGFFGQSAQTSPQQSSSQQQTPQQPQRSNSGRMAPALPHADRYRQPNKGKQVSVSSADAPKLSPFTAQPPLERRQSPDALSSSSNVEESVDVPVLNRHQSGESGEVSAAPGGGPDSHSKQPQRIAVKNNDSDSDDEEYVRNPFDDRD